MVNNFVYLFLFFLMGCEGFKVSLDNIIDSQANFNASSEEFNLEGEAELRGKKTEEFEYQWTINFVDGLGFKVGPCVIDFTRAADQIHDYTTKGIGCDDFVPSGVGYKVKVSLNPSRVKPVYMTYCLQVKDPRTGEVEMQKSCKNAGKLSFLEAPVILQPVSGSHLNNSTNLISGTCDPGLTVNIEGDIVGSLASTTCSLAGTFSANVDLLPGDSSKVIVATQSNPGGQRSTSTTVNTVLDTTSSVSLSGSLATINLANVSSYQVSGTCSDIGINNVVISIVGMLDVNTNCSVAGTFSQSVDASLASDSLSLNVSVTHNDLAGNTSTDNSNVLKDTIPPTGLTQTGLSNGSVLTNRVVSIGGSCEVGGTVGVTGDIETVLGPFTTNCLTGVWAIDIALSRGGGLKNIIFNQTDLAGNSQVTPVTHNYTFNLRTVTSKKIATLDDASCFIHTDGKLLCNGRDRDGALGNGTARGDQLIPEEIDMTSHGIANNFINVDGSGTNVCAVHFSGRVFCWGYGEDALGDGTSTLRNHTPVEINMSAHTESNDFTRVSVGATFGTTCAIHSTGQVFCWGESDHGRLGNGLTIDQSSPVKIDMSATSHNNNFTDIASTQTSVCAVHQSGRIYCWGEDHEGALGNGGGIGPDQLTPGLIDMSSHGLYDNDFVQVAGGRDGPCSVHSSGRVYCWGDGFDGAGGDGNNSDAQAPSEIDMSAHVDLNNFIQVSTGSRTGCAIHVNGKAYCWGNNSLGGVSDATAIYRLSPVEVVLTDSGKSNNFQEVSVQGGHTCARHNDNTFVCSGQISYGQLGNGEDHLVDDWVELDMSSSPESNDFKQVNFSRHTSCALHSNGKAFCWGGQNVSYRRGVNAGGISRFPLEIDMSAHSDNNNFSDLAKQYDSSYVIHAVSQKVYAWGFNGNSSEDFLGTGDVTSGNQNTPVEIDMSAHVETNTFTDVTALHRGGCGIHTSGQLFCWGRNDSGQVGDGTTTLRISPTKVDMSATGDPNSFIKVSSRADANIGVYAIHTNGKLYQWGRGITTPIEVDMSHTSDVNSFADVSGSMYGGCAIHTNGKVYCEGTPNGVNASGSQPMQEINMSAHAEMNDFVSLSSASHSFYYQTVCGVHTSGKMFCWGDHDDYFYGFLGAPDYLTPVEMDFSGIGYTNNILSSATGWEHQCTIHDGGVGNQRVLCVGSNLSGQLGDDGVYRRLQFQLVDMTNM